MRLLKKLSFLGASSTDSESETLIFKLKSGAMPQ